MEYINNYSDSDKCHRGQKSTAAWRDLLKRSPAWNTTHHAFPFSVGHVRRQPL